jgi:hypothetical protein
MRSATFWVIFLQTHLVALIASILKEAVRKHLKNLSFERLN